MENTIGVIIYDTTGKILITKPTNGNIWSLPKGIPDDNEDFKSAAIREVLEETSLNLNEIKGEFSNTILSQPYKKRAKIVHLYTFKSFELLENNYEIKCDSFFELEGKFYPENDDSKWITIDEAINLVHEAQKELLKKLIDK